MCYCLKFSDLYSAGEILSSIMSLYDFHGGYEGDMARLHPETLQASSRNLLGLFSSKL